MTFIPISSKAIAKCGRSIYLKPENVTGGGGMRKRFVFLCVISLIVASASPIFAGGIENKTNWSAEYIRTFNRNAATDSADIVMYNPAGVTKMGDGFYGNFSAQYINKDYTNRINGTDYDSDEPSYIPGLFLLYKKDRWAGFFALSNVLGGGKVDYENGDATTSAIGLGLITNANALLAANSVPANFFYSSISNQNLNAEQIGLGYTLGGTFKINDNVHLIQRHIWTKRCRSPLHKDWDKDSASYSRRRSGKRSTFRHRKRSWYIWYGKGR